MFTEKKKEEFKKMYEELDNIIDIIVSAKAEYGKYKYVCDYYSWEYDNDAHIFDVEIGERGYQGCSDEMYYMQVTWEEIFDVENIVEILKTKKIERDKKAAEKKLVDKAKEKKYKIEAEKAEYERLKSKFEKS